MYTAGLRVSETGSGRRVARAAKRPVMWALPVLRTRSYLVATEFHAHAASSGSLSPCDLYLVNLGSVVRCETSIRPLRPAQQWASSTAAAALEWKGQQAIDGAVAEGIRRMRDLYRAGGRRRGVRGAFGSGGSSHRLLGLFFLRPLLLELRTKRASFFCPPQRTPHTR